MIGESSCRRWARLFASRLRRLASPLRERGITLDLDERANDAARTRIIGIRRNHSAD